MTSLPENSDKLNGAMPPLQEDEKSNTESPREPQPVLDGTDKRSPTAMANRRRMKDPYRHILPHRMSFHTTGVLATFLRPSSGLRRGATVSPSVDPASRGGTPKRGRRKSSNLAQPRKLGKDVQNEPRPIVPISAREHISFKTGKRHSHGPDLGKNYRKKNSTDYNDVNRYNAEGYAALHTAAQSNHLGWMGELLKNNADVDLPAVSTGFTPLHLAARYGWLEAAMLLLKNGASCDASTHLGQRPIHLAARRGHADIIRVLLEYDKDQVKAFDKDLMTPLHMAAISGDIDVCQLLINNGVDIGAREVSNMTAVMMACAVGHQSFIHCVLQSAPSQGLKACDLLLHTDNEMKTVLHIAISNGCKELVKFLLDSGADVNAQCGMGHTPLHLIAVVGNTDIANLLLDFGATIEKGDNELMTPLHRAAMYNRLAMVGLLLDKGADINAREKDHFTPLLCACWRGHVEIVKLLIQRGADLNLRDCERKTCLHWSVEMGHSEIVSVLFEATGLGLLESEDRMDQTVLHYTAETANVALLNLLLVKGAKVDTRDNEEKTPLHIACQFGHLACVKILLQHSPNLLNTDDMDGMTPLLLASHNGHPSIVRFLLDTGADIASKNDEWKTALALAASKNHVHTVTVLIENNADINALDKEKNTPLHLVCQAGHQLVAKLLLAARAELTHCNRAGLYALDYAIENQHLEIAKAIVTSKDWESALSNRNDKGLSPMKKLIKKMPDAALLVLDHCSKKSHSDPNHPDLEITCDFSYLDPGPDDHLTGENNIIDKKKRFFALKTMLKYNRQKLLCHELPQCILSRKWSKFAGIFFMLDFFFYLIFLGCLTHYTSSSQLITSEMQLNSMGCVEVDANDTAYIFNEEGIVIRIADPWLWVSQSLISIYCLFLLVMKFLHLLQLRVAFFLAISNYVAILLCASSLIFTYPPFYPPCSLAWNAGAIANFLAGIHFLLYLQPIRYFGIYVGMFLTTSSSLLKAMVVYVFFFLSFGLCFYICFSRLDAFRSPGDALLTTFVMTLGEINKSDIFDAGISLSPFEHAGHILFILFLFMMPMVLMNLTIGIAVGDIEAIFKSAYLKQQQILVDLIWGYETKLPKFLQRRIYESKVTMRPNKANKRTWTKDFHVG
ncbi:transient receptor potential cation channel subfamily A member 1-like isoform X2 [Acanthaster planci]|uniref:Transient receptor potential cation channel subfamily A member 1-like isoform X2 n=1 Tax=Acanthaster planci TaxID=133434 RepID=A0A8B7YIE7_ACAPL|nr:transient receptor potential cation channel subfamily A member 1-like isoform X2 [Acanthaster planci]